MHAAICLVLSRVKASPLYVPFGTAHSRPFLIRVKTVVNLQIAVKNMLCKI